LQADAAALPLKQVIAMIYYVGKRILPESELNLPQEQKNKISLQFLERNTKVSTVTISSEEKAIQMIVTDTSLLKQIF
jgi:hypothetical protein